MSPSKIVPSTILELVIQDAGRVAVPDTNKLPLTTTFPPIKAFPPIPAPPATWSAPDAVLVDAVVFFIDVIPPTANVLFIDTSPKSLIVIIKFASS